MAILRTLEEIGHHHPSFSQVCSAVQSDHPNISQSTILKNLEAFERIGILRSFHYRGETRYELNPAPHVNLIREDGAIVDIEDDAIRGLLVKLQRAVAERVGADVDRILIIAETEQNRG